MWQNYLGGLMIPRSIKDLPDWALIGLAAVLWVITMPWAFLGLIKYFKYVERVINL